MQQHQDEAPSSFTATPTEDLYAILQLYAGASTTDIKKQFRALSKECHPDKNHEPAALQQFQLLAKAYEWLSDPIKRQLYDSSRAKPVPVKATMSMAVFKGHIRDKENLANRSIINFVIANAAEVCIMKRYSKSQRNLFHDLISCCSAKSFVAVCEAVRGKLPLQVLLEQENPFYVLFYDSKLKHTKAKICALKFGSLVNLYIHEYSPKEKALEQVKIQLFKAIHDAFNIKVGNLSKKNKVLIDMFSHIDEEYEDLKKYCLNLIATKSKGEKQSSQLRINSELPTHASSFSSMGDNYKLPSSFGVKREFAKTEPTGLFFDKETFEQEAGFKQEFSDFPIPDLKSLSDDFGAKDEFGISASETEELSKQEFSDFPIPDLSSFGAFTGKQSDPDILDPIPDDDEIFKSEAESLKNLNTKRKQEFMADAKYRGIFASQVKPREFGAAEKAASSYSTFWSSTNSQAQNKRKKPPFVTAGYFQTGDKMPKTENLTTDEAPSPEARRIKTEPNSPV